MTRVTQTCTCSPFRKKCRPGLGRGFRSSSSDPLRICMTTPTLPGTSQRAMEVVFASIVSQLHPELREALISSGLDDPGLLRAYPRSSVEDLRAMGLGIPIALSTSSSPSIPPSFPSSSIPQGQHIVPVVSTTATLRPRGPERRRIMKKGGMLQTGVTDNSHVPLDGWAHVSSRSTVSPSFPPSLPVASSHVSVATQSFTVVSGRSSRDVSVGFQLLQGWRVLRTRIHVIRSSLRIWPSLTHPC